MTSKNSRLLIDSIHAKLSDPENNWVRDERWLQTGCIVVKREGESQPYEAKDYSKSLPTDVASIGCAGWDEVGALHVIHVELDVGHGDPRQSYAITDEAIAAARTIRDFVGGSAEIRRSKNDGIHVRIRPKAGAVPENGREVSKNIAWWLKAQLGFRCDHAALSRQCLDFWSAHTGRFGFSKLDHCCGEWEPSLDAIHTPYKETQTKLNDAKVLTPIDESALAGTWKGWTVDERQRAYASYILSENFPQSIQGNKGSNDLFSVCGIRHAFALDRTHALPIIERYNERKCVPPWTAKEIAHKLDDAKYNGEVGDKLKRPYELNDAGNAKRLVDHYGDVLRWCPEHRTWYVWSGTHWSKDDGDLRIASYAKLTRKTILDDASNASSDELKDKIKTFHRQSGNTHRINGMIGLAKSEKGVAISADALDQSKHLFNCPNGTLDLKTGRLLPHDKNHYISKIAKARFDSTADCPKWKSFVSKIFAGDADLIAWVQRWCGYCLSGSVGERVMVVAHGDGRNGKSTMFETVRKVMGDYAQSANAESLMTKDNNAIRNDLAAWSGKRLLICSESKDRCHLDEAIVKKVTGNDLIRARFLHCEEFEFPPTHKIVLYTNHKPRLSGDDRAIWDRVRLLPFHVRIPDNEVIKDFQDILFDEEANGILKWIVDGVLAWQQHGLGDCLKVREATTQYQEECDTVVQFLTEMCEECPGYQAKASELFKNYERWCQDNAYSAVTMSQFGKQLTAKFQKKKTSSGFVYSGVHLLSSDDASDSITHIKLKYMTKQSKKESGE